MYGLAMTLYEFMLEDALDYCVLAQSENIIATFPAFAQLVLAVRADSPPDPNMPAHVRSTCDAGSTINPTRCKGAHHARVPCYHIGSQLMK